MRWVPRPAAAGCECPPAPGSPGVWGARPRGEGAAGWGALEERYSMVPEQVQWNHHRALKHACLSPVAGRRRHARARAGGGCCGLGCTWGKVFHGSLGWRSLPTMCPDSTSPHMVLMFNGTITVPSDCLPRRSAAARARARSPRVLRAGVHLGCTLGERYSMGP